MRAWPLFDLRVRTPRLELRFPTDEDLDELVTIARLGLHDPDQDVFKSPSWENLPSPEFERQFVRYFWGLRANWSPDDWTLTLAAIVDGHAVGVQDMTGKDFAHRRSVSTGSWMGRVHQGQGLGTEMRAGALALAFDGLGALAAESAYLEGNIASARISEKLGYVSNGQSIVAPRGRPVIEHKVRVDRDQWHRSLVPFSIEGLDGCRELFGVGGSG